MMEESAGTASEADSQCRDQELAVRSGDDKHGDGTNRCLSGRQAIHVVEKVERIRDSHYPQHRQQHVNKLFAGQGDPHVHPPQLHRAEDLCQQPDRRRKIPEVIGQAHHPETNCQDQYRH